jgi:hypothetical protein
MKEQEPSLPNDTSVLVTGARGFMGGHLVAEFRRPGNQWIRAVDAKPLDKQYQRFDDVENLLPDLNRKENCDVPAAGAAEIYNLAASRHGMDFIEHSTASCMLSILINTHLLQEITARVPARTDSAATSFASVSDLANVMGLASAARGEHEKRVGKADANWPDWYAAYMVAEQSGNELPQ